MAKKYLNGGALNPAWCDEQDEVILSNSIMSGICNLFNNMDIELNVQLMEGVDLNISKKANNMCTIIDTNDYEAKFNFIKNHSTSLEELQLAKEIVGLK